MAALGRIWPFGKFRDLQIGGLVLFGFPKFWKMTGVWTFQGALVAGWEEDMWSGESVPHYDEGYVEWIFGPAPGGDPDLTLHMEQRVEHLSTQDKNFGYLVWYLGAERGPNAQANVQGSNRTNYECICGPARLLPSPGPRASTSGGKLIPVTWADLDSL